MNGNCKHRNDCESFIKYLMMKGVLTKRNETVDITEFGVLYNLFSNVLGIKNANIFNTEHEINNTLNKLNNLYKKQGLKFKFNYDLWKQLI